MASQTVSTFSSALKTLYGKRGVIDLTLGGNTLLAMVSKSTDFGGNNFVYSVGIGDVAGTGPTFSDAQAGKKGSVKKQFTVTRAKYYAVASIDNELIEASRQDAHAFVSGLKSEVDSAFRVAGRQLGMLLYRDGTGSIGTIDSTTNLATTSLVLSNPSDVYNFDVGQQLVFANTVASALRTATTLTVSAVNGATKTLTLSATPNSLSAGIATGDLIFQKGWYTAANDELNVYGLEAHVPATAPTAGDSHYGLDRSTYVERLAGHRVTGTSLNLDEAIYKAAIAIAPYGMPSHAFMSLKQYEVLQNTLAGRVNPATFTLSPNVYFEGVKLAGPRGPISVYPDFNCPDDVCWVLDLSKFHLKSIKAMPHILGLEDGGERLLRESTADGYELRIGGYGNSLLWDPACVGRISLTVPS